nr:hypothetical protein [Tanacetum cinerariifolium]
GFLLGSDGVSSEIGVEVVEWRVEWGRGFEEVPNREGSRTERNTKGNRPSKAGAEENERREMNLPLLLVAHLERNENGQPLQSFLTSVHGGSQSLINIGGNPPPNGRITMQKMGMVVSLIHEPIKFQTTQGIETVFSTHESDKIGEGVKKTRETSLANKEGVLSCTDAKEKIIVNSLLSEDSKESWKIRIKATQYKLIRGSLYKKSFYTSWLCCIASPKIDGAIKKIDNGSCGFNTEPHSMVVRITKQGYYWPSMHKDVARIIEDCEKCKEQSAVRKRAKIEAIAAGNAWPFSYWGVSILRPLPTAVGGLKFLTIAIEHSTKWIEAKPLTTVNARHVERFVWEYVECRFIVPQITSSKDDKHFKEGIFVDLCRGLKIIQSFSPSQNT